LSRRAQRCKALPDSGFARPATDNGALGTSAIAIYAAESVAMTS
jgi:hypothetical protein